MARITTIKYSFRPPKEISEMEYHSYKQMLMVNYNADICPKDIPTEIGFSGKKIARWSLMAASVLIAPAAFISEVDSKISQSRAKSAMNRFYNNDLKKLIVNSKSYEQFCLEYKRYF